MKKSAETHNCSSVVKVGVRRVVRDACTVRASWIEREGGRTRANEGEFMARGEKENKGVEEEVDKSMKLRFSRFIIGPYPDTVHCVLCIRMAVFNLSSGPCPCTVGPATSLIEVVTGRDVLAFNA